MVMMRGWPVNTVALKSSAAPDHSDLLAAWQVSLIGVVGLPERGIRVAVDAVVRAGAVPPDVLAHDAPAGLALAAVLEGIRACEALPEERRGAPAAAPEKRHQAAVVRKCASHQPVVDAAVADDPAGREIDLLRATGDVEAPRLVEPLDPPRDPTDRLQAGLPPFARSRSPQILPDVAVPCAIDKTDDELARVVVQLFADAPDLPENRLRGERPADDDRVEAPDDTLSPEAF